MPDNIVITAELKDLISGHLKEITSQVNKLDGSIANMGSKGSGGIMGSVVGANLLTSAIGYAKNAIVDFGRGSIDAFAKQESFLVSLKTMFHGNAIEAEVLNGQLQRFAKETPFELTEIQDATKMMIAYGSSSSSVVKEMTMLGDVSSGVGSSLSEVGYLYGTLRTQGRAFSKDIYQFTGRGIPIVKELAKQFKVTDSEVMKLVEDGKVGFKEVERAFQSMTGEGGQFFNMMKEQSGTLAGQTSNLADAWNQLKANVGESQEGILKQTVAWASKMVGAAANAFKFENFSEKNLKGYKNSEYSTFGGYESDLDKRYAKQGDDGRFSDYSKEGGSYDTQFGSKSRVPIGGKEQAEEFSKSIFDKIEKLSPEDAQTQLNEFIVIGRELKQQRTAGEMSNKLYLNELLNLKKGIETASQLINGNKKNAPGAKGDGTTPAISDLEKVAKANRPTQINVNIENLVREINNTYQNVSKGMELTGEQIAKVLIGVVNDVSVTNFGN